MSPPTVRGFLNLWRLPRRRYLSQQEQLTRAVAELDDPAGVARELERQRTFSSLRARVRRWHESEQEH